MLCQETIMKYLHKKITVHLYDSIGSTNDEAKRRADADGGVCLYAAEHQSAGRGRRGRSFYSPKGTGLYMTLALPYADVSEAVCGITCAAAVAVCETVESLSNHHPQIKWVNDIFVGGKKVAGILTELITDDHNQPRAVIVGIGLNLNTAEFPAELAATAGNLGAIEKNALCGMIADRLITMTEQYDNNSVMEKYKGRNLCIGRRITYMQDGVEHLATAVDIDAGGGLVVEENGLRTTLNAGEISVTPLSP